MRRGLIILILVLAGRSGCKSGDAESMTEGRHSESLLGHANSSETEPPDMDVAKKIAETERPRVDAAAVEGMVFLPGGSFRGQDIDAFYMDVTEVTVADYQHCVEAGKCKTPRTTSIYDNYGTDGRDDHPVNAVSWNDANDYCTSVGKRLPTESEWEWAARGREEGRKYPWGEEKESCERAVTFEHVATDSGYKMTPGCGEDRTWPVGSKPAGDSRDGLKDMAGNVWEWTASRVLRGGAWHPFLASSLEISSRLRMNPTFRDHSVGLRCVHFPPQIQPK